MPRFSDDPRRPPPRVGPTDLAIRIGDGPERRFDRDALERLGPVELVADFHCVTTWSVRGVSWRGVPLRKVVGHDQPPLPRFAAVRGGDGYQAVFLTADLLADDVHLVTRRDGIELDADHGAPLRLIAPQQYGYKSVKHVVAIHFVADEPPSLLGSKEHLRARVAREERHRRLPSRLVRLPYRLVVPPTAMLCARSGRSS